MGVAAVFGAEAAGLDAELGDGVDVRDGDAPLVHRRVGGEAVDQELGVFQGHARALRRVAPFTGILPAAVAHARDEVDQLGGVSPVDGQVDNLARFDRAGDGALLGLDQLDAGAFDGDLLGDVADFEHRTHAQPLADEQLRPFDRPGLEAFQRHRDIVEASVQTQDFEDPDFVRGGGDVLTGFDVRDGNIGAGYDGARRVGGDAQNRSLRAELCG